MKNSTLKLTVTGLLFLLSINVHAGLYTDDLSRCLVESTTTEDKLSLVRWMFAAATLHPAVKSLAAISDKQRDEANKRVGELFIKLVTESCRDKAQKAVSYEGGMAIQGSFQILGQVAARELFASPEVSAGMAGLDKYIDKKKLETVFGKTPGN